MRNARSFGSAGGSEPSPAVIFCLHLSDTTGNTAAARIVSPQTGGDRGLADLICRTSSKPEQESSRSSSEPHQEPEKAESEC